MDVDSSLMLNCDPQCEKTSDDDSKNIHRKRLQVASKLLFWHLEGTLERPLVKLRNGCIKRKPSLSPLPVETVDLVAQHAAEVMESDRLNRRIHELQSMIKELRGHLE